MSNTFNQHYSSTYHLYGHILVSVQAPRLVDGRKTTFTQQVLYFIVLQRQTALKNSVRLPPSSTPTSIVSPNARLDNIASLFSVDLLSHLECLVVIYQKTKAI